MKRLVAAIASTAMVVGALVAGSPPAAASTTWAFPAGSFTITETAGSRTATVDIQNLRITDGSTASGYVRVTAVGVTCSTSSFTGLAANFFVGAYEPCSGSVSFSVSAIGDLAVTSALVVKGSLFSGPMIGSARGISWPPQMTCTAVLNGSTGVDLKWTDPGSGATSYAISATPSLPSLVSVSIGPNATTVTGLSYGTDYAFTVTGTGGTATPATCTARTEDRPLPPIAKVSYGAITGATGSARQEVLLTVDGQAPTGWTLAWTLRTATDVALPVTVGCGLEQYFVPEWRKVGEPAIRGAEITARPPCTVPIPSFAGGTIAGENVTVSYQFPGPVEPGVEVWAYWRYSGSGPAVKVSLGAPPAGGSRGSGSFVAPGLPVPVGVTVQLQATNGPVDSPRSALNSIEGELPVLQDYATTVTGVEGETAVKATANPVPGNFTPSAQAKTAWIYVLAPGSTLPAGVTVSPASGVVKGNGRPLAAGRGTALVMLQTLDKKRSSNAVRVNYDIAPVPPAPTAMSYPAVSAVVGYEVRAQPSVGAAVKKPRYFFSPELCSNYPWLKLDNASGQISGRPTSLWPSSTVAVTMTYSPGDPCGQPQGSPVAKSQIPVRVSAPPQSLAYGQSSLTALVGSVIRDTPTSVPFTGAGIAFAVTAGTLPSGVTIDSATGAISGVANAPVMASTVTITATQGPAVASTTVTFSILPLPSGVLAALAYPNVTSAPIGVPMSVLPLGVVTGQVFSLDTSSLRAGLTIDPGTGRITWTPTAPTGSRTVTVTVTAAGTSTALTPFTITVAPALATSNASPGNAPPSSTGASSGGPGGSSGSAGSGAAANPCLAPNGTLYTDFHGSAASTLTMVPNTFGMSVPKSFTITKGALPHGVYLDGAVGVISGTPERSNGGNGAIEITTTWSDGTVRVSDFTIAVDDPHHAVNYPNRIIGSVGQPVTVTPLKVNSHGKTRFQIVCGTLPSGLTMSASTGVITGTPIAIDERPIPLRVRMTDSYGWVDSSLLFVVNPGVTPWLRYVEFAEIGYGRTVRLVPTRSGLPATDSYRITGALPPGLVFNRKTGTISGVAKVHDGFVYEPTVTAFGTDGIPQVSTVPSLTVIKPAVPMTVVARSAVRPARLGTTVLVTKVKHPAYAKLSARVACGHCTVTFNKRTGRLVVHSAKGTKSVTVTIVGQPSGAKATAVYTGHTWTRKWRMQRQQRVA